MDKSEEERVMEEIKRICKKEGYIGENEDIFEGEVVELEDGGRIKSFYIGEEGEEPSWVIEYDLDYKTVVIYAYGTGAGRRLLAIL